MIGLPPVNTFVLQRTPYRESSQLLRLLNTQFGHTTVIYRGSEAVYLYQPYHVDWSGRPESPQMRSMEVAGKVLRLPGAASYLALYLNELCGLLLPRGVPAEALVGTYYATLKGLQAGEPAEPLLRFFELRLLAHLGFALELNTDTHGDRLRPEFYYRFDGINQFMPVAAGDASNSDVLAGATLQAIARHEFADPLTLTAAKRLLRQALQYHLGTQTLQSRELFRKLAVAGRREVPTQQDGNKGEAL